jgi:phenylacetate-coenzyme A ligase PaaK-like adenylate-forming protein
MDWHATLTRTVIGPLWARWEGSPYLRHYRRLVRTQYDALEVIRDRQWAAVQAMLRHAYDTVPFYRRRFDEAGLHPDQVRHFDDYQRIPILTKADIRAHKDALLSDRFAPQTVHTKRTSGSTGVALEVRVDEPAMQFKRACTLRSDEWSGWRFGEPIALIWGDPEPYKNRWRGRLRNALLERTRGLDTLKMDQDALERFVADLRRKRPSLIMGHAHSVYLFAEYARSAGIHDIRPKGVLTTAMVLHDWQRRAIEEVFACRVTNRYGCEEVSLIACECERHEGLHVNADGVYVEYLRERRPVEPGEPGSLIITDLANRAMPILRYQIGDVAVAADRRCPCGRGLPLLDRLEGREADYVVTPAGKLISGISLTDHLGTQIPGVAQLQIIQETVDRFRFRIVRGPDFGPASLERLRAVVDERFGAGVTFECEYIERIPQEPSGKYRFCISKVENPFTRAREAVVS